MASSLEDYDYDNGTKPNMESPKKRLTLSNLTSSEMKSPPRTEKKKTGGKLKPIRMYSSKRW